MTNAELLAKIRAEIERLQPNAPKPGNMKSVDAKVAMQVHARLNKLLSFISDLEKSLPEKVADDKVLEVEAVSYCFDNGLNISPRVATDFARHFYGLGCYHTAEKYDEIEYNRQRASGSSEIPKDLDAAAIQAAQSDMQDRQIMEASNDERMLYSRIFRRGFKAGAKWQEEKDGRIYRDFFDARNQGDASFLDLLAYREGHRDGMDEQREQMMKDAYDGEFFYNPYPGIALDDCKDYDFKQREDVLVVVLPKED